MLKEGLLQQQRCAPSSTGSVWCTGGRPLTTLSGLPALPGDWYWEPACSIRLIRTSRVEGQHQPGLARGLPQSGRASSADAIYGEPDARTTAAEQH